MTSIVSDPQLGTPVTNSSSSISVQIRGQMKEMAKSYGITHCLYYSLSKIGVSSVDPVLRASYSALAALSVPIQPATHYCFSKLLGCNEDTRWRNITRNVATSITACCISAVACNTLGYDINTAAIVYQQLQLLGIGLAGYIMIKGIEFVDDKIESGKKNEKTVIIINSNRVKQIQDTSATKTQRIKDAVLDETEIQSGLLP